MKKGIIIVGIVGLAIVGGLNAKRKFYDPQKRLENTKTIVKQPAEKDEIKNGDLIFQSSLSGQSQAIQLATNSKYSQCGIIYSDNVQFYVFEAIQPVTKTPLDKWIARGKDGRFVIKRLKNADQVLIAETIQKMKQEGDKFNGKKYDLTFKWSDDKLYCFELI
jgi:hypothetical protein